MSFMRAASTDKRVSAYEVVHASHEFQRLRHRFGAFVVPAIVAFLGWYFLYVICAGFAPGFMRARLFGEVNVGLCFGLAQFASTFAVTAAYLRWGRRRFDPYATHLRATLDEGRER